MAPEELMVRDGYWYAISLLFVAAVVRFFTADWFASWVLVAIPILLAAFFLWFFRDPNRPIPAGPGLVVSPADGKVTEVAPIHTPDGDRIRLSIFLSVFDVHVNRSPIAGTVRSIQYKKGEFLNALDPASAERNEQSVVVMEGEGCIISLRLIAGLLARRIVFVPKEGDTLKRGERVGLIKFGSRCDLILPGDAHIRVERGQRVKGGESILADVEVPSYDPMLLKEVMETRP
jgi:phosphatidylserine decarboxylase